MALLTRVCQGSDTLYRRVWFSYVKLTVTTTARASVIAVNAVMQKTNKQTNKNNNNNKQASKQTNKTGLSHEQKMKKKKKKKVGPTYVLKDYRAQ